MRKIATILILLLVAGFLLLQLARNQQDEISRKRSNAIAHSIADRPIYYGGE